MSAKAILAPRLHGKRFDDGQIPVEVLADLAELGKMIAAVAKWRYMKENPERQRVPKGFTEAVNLKLSSVGETESALPIFSVSQDATPSYADEVPYRKYLDEAQAYIAEVVIEAESGPVVSDAGLPSKFLKHFNRIGQNLVGDDFMELTHPVSQSKARLTVVSRQRLLERASTPQKLTDATLRGTVPEVDLENKNFQLKQVFGRKISYAPMPDVFESVVVSAFNGYYENQRIMVKGVCDCDEWLRPQRFKSIEEVIPLPPLDVPARLDEFKHMKVGYRGTRAPSPEGLDWLSQSFSRHFPESLPLPRVYPVEEGRIEMEWVCNILEIDLDAHRGDWFAFGKESDMEESEHLDFEDDGSWEFIVEKLRRRSMAIDE